MNDLSYNTRNVQFTVPMLKDKAKDFYEKVEHTVECVFSGGWLTNSRLDTE